MNRPTLPILAAVLIITGCTPTDAPDVLATIGTKKIRTADLQAEIARRQSAKRPIPPLPDLLTEMVDYEILLQSALAAGLDNAPDVQRTYHNLLIGTLKDDKLRPILDAATVSEQAITAHYQANQDDYLLPARTRLSVIFVAANTRASDTVKQQARQRAEQAHTLASTDADGFQKAAVQFSDDQSSRYKGGDIGWIKKAIPHSRIPTEVTAAALGLETNTISGILETDDGFYLAKPTAREPESYVPLEKVHAAISSTLLKQKRAKVAADFYAGLKAKSGVQTFPARLEKLDLPASAPPQEPTPPQL